VAARLNGLPGRVSMTWVLFDYGGVLCHPQPEHDRDLLARAGGGRRADFEAAYWHYRLDYDRAALDTTAYWQRVAAWVGTSYTDAQIAELSRLDTASWLHLQAGTVELAAGLAAAGYRLAVLSNAPADVAVAVPELPMADYFEHLLFSCFLKSAKPDRDCFRAALGVLGAPPAEVIFLDDRADNVAAASEMGIRSLQFTGTAAARAGLAGFGVTATTD
jgi:putative hydrolase of the HAD superfamily